MTAMTWRAFVRVLASSLVASSMATGLALASSGPAQARTLVHNDAANDVRSFSLDSFSDATIREPGVTDGDITQVRVIHGTHAVRVRVAFADLTRHDLLYGSSLRVRTSDGLGRHVRLVAGEGMGQGRVRMYTPNGYLVHCQMQHSINFVTNIIKISFPRRCIGRPAWVRVGVGVVRLADDPDSTRGYVDDAFRNDHYGSEVALSRRIVSG